MTRTKAAARTTTVTVVRDRYRARVRGPVRVVLPAIKAADAVWSWDHASRCLCVPLAKVDDVLAALDAAGVRVSVDGAVGGLW